MRRIGDDRGEHRVSGPGAALQQQTDLVADGAVDQRERLAAEPRLVDRRQGVLEVLRPAFVVGRCGDQGQHRDSVPVSEKNRLVRCAWISRGGTADVSRAKAPFVIP